jgi:glycosyltransferase involved in cell wall biosynthesis
MKIAFVTPWPPQATGIGDYVYDLVSDIVQFNCEISVFTDSEIPEKINGINFFGIDKVSLSELKHSDLIVYQMGNNVNFHLYMLDLIKEYPGIVHLHDMVLHHVMGWITWMQGDLDGYLNLIAKWYSPRIAGLCRELMDQEVMPWDAEIVSDLPLFQEFLQYANACIVHSAFVCRKVSDAFPTMPVYHIPQLLKGMRVVEKSIDPSSRILNIGIFGGIEPNKNVDTILKVFSKLRSKFDHCQLHLVGGVGEKCSHILDFPGNLGISDCVICHGRLHKDRFIESLAAMDLIVAMRFPTMGETSGIVCRAMQMAIPVIVSDVGWYSELPEFVDKVSVQNMQEHLLQILQNYLSDTDYLANKKQQFLSYAMESLNRKEMLKEYFNILRGEYRSKQNSLTSRIIAEKLNGLKLEGESFIRIIGTRLSNLYVH